MTINNIPLELYYDNQLLKLDDFQREQNYHIAYRELQTRTLCTAGILQGLTVTNNGTQIAIAPGIALDDSGQCILLADRATFNGSQIAPQEGGFVIELNEPDYYNNTWLLTIAFNETAVAGANNQEASSPVLALAMVNGTPSPSTGQIGIATVVVTSTGVAPNNKVSLSLDTSIGSQSTILQSRIPALDASQITSGTLNAAQLPEIPADKLTGQLSLSQIPEEIVFSFYAEAPCLSNGAQAQINWQASPLYDLTLDYLSLGAPISQSDLQKGTGSLQIPIVQSTLFTLTASVQGQFVAQRQVRIEVSQTDNQYASQLQYDGYGTQQIVGMLAQRYSYTALSTENVTALAKALLQAHIPNSNITQSIPAYYQAQYGQGTFTAKYMTALFKALSS